MKKTSLMNEETDRDSIKSIKSAVSWYYKYYINQYY